MGGLTSYSGISAKLKAMRAKMLTEQDFEKIAQFPTVADAFSWLRKHPGYEKALASIPELDVHRGDVERVLNLSIYEDYQRIYHFADAGQRKFLTLYFKRYEVSLIKRCFRLAVDGKSVLPLLYGAEDFFARHSKLNIQRLDDANSLAEAIAALEGSEYYAPLSRLMGEEVSLFDLEMALDMYYFAQIWKSRGKIASGADLAVLTEAFGAKFDMINLNWIARSRRYSGLTSQDVLAMLIPVEHHIHRKDLKALTAAETPEAFAEALAGTWYAKRYEELTPQTLEEGYVTVLKGTLEKESVKHPHSMAILWSYLYRKEHEVDRLTTALEGIRYGLDPAAILGLIHRE